MTDPMQRLEKVLTPLGESAEFQAQGTFPPVLPGLEVEGVGPIGLPISAAVAQRLIAVAEQAPYGRGTETIVDTGVRRVWQLEPSQFVLRNPDWDAQVEKTVAAVKKQFAIRGKVCQELYKLLVYETGSFFVPHRDTEKTPGMFATLVVCLPSRHEGGTLVVEHEGRAVRVDFGGPKSEFRTAYAAFYADCRHEIEPVLSGYRVCLIYNLALQRAPEQPTAPRSSPVIAEAADVLRELFADPSRDLNKVIIPLEHQYTEEGLHPAELKGADRARVEVLARAAESLDYQCFLALVTHYQTGSVDYGTWEPPYYRSRRSRRSYYHDDYEEESDPEEDAGADFEEVIDERLSLDHWQDMSGQMRPFGELSVEEGELLGGDDREGWAVAREISEATGNAGASMDRWYRRCAVVIWPRDRFFRILAAEGQAHALPELERMAAQATDPEALAECRNFAGAILDYWGKSPAPGQEGAWPARMLHVLARIGTAELAERFVREGLAAGFTGQEGQALLRLLQRFGWKTLQPDLLLLLEQQQPVPWEVAPIRLLSLLAPLYGEPSTWTPERRDVCASLAKALGGVVQRWGKQPNYGYGHPAESRKGLVAHAVRIFALGSAPEVLDCFLDRALRGELGCGLHTVLIPDVKAIAAWLQEAPAARPAYTRLREHCLDRLRAATAEPVQFPTDWRRAATLSCKCEDCAALSRFLADPTAPVGRFPMAEGRRQHLHHQIDQHRCDCTHETERRGRPYTLVCTKTTASFERREKQYQVDMQLLKEIEQLPPG